MLKVEIKNIQKRDIPEVAEIHFKYLKLGVLSHLGVNFLIKFYQVLIKNDSTFTFVAVSEGVVIGFATGATNLKAIPTVMVRNLWLAGIVAIFAKPAIAFKIVQMFSYPSFKTNENIGEIFSLAVSSEFRSRGVGTKLIRSCQKEFAKRGCRHFQLSVRSKMLEANKFYKKLKLKKIASGRFLNEEIIFYGN